MRDHRQPWEIIKAESADRGGVRVWGLNHYRGGERFIWEIDPRFYRLDGRYDFGGCVWVDEGAKRIIAEARRAIGRTLGGR